MNTIMNILNYNWTITICTLFLAIAITACSGEKKQGQESESTLVFNCIEAGADSMAVDSASAKIDINAGTENQFKTIPDVGDRMVHEFEEYRPYASIQQFRQEIGKYVDEEQVAAYEQYIYVPVKANESDAATLMQIPGLDADEAEAFISGRPYATQQDVMDKLTEYMDETQLAAAKTYLGC